MPGPDGDLRRNEGLALDTVCVDNCPFYFLPNVFSPNRDGTNDEFQAFPWKFIDSVDVRIHSRWGELVFQTSDPEVGWNGLHMATGEAVSDGVYTCTVTAYTRRLEGIVPERFVQELHVVSGTGVTTD
jgi:gliding motility-associated-like protein